MSRSELKPTEKLKATATPVPGGVSKDIINNPSTVLASTAIARTLTISDQHATILLTSGYEPVTKNVATDANETLVEPTCSLLKLTLVPFHKASLSKNSQEQEMLENNLKDDAKKSDMLDKAEKEQEHTGRILKFLDMFEWRLTSESGAEYSYYEAFLKKQKEPHKQGAEEHSFPKAKRARVMDNTSLEEATPIEESEIAAKWSAFKVELISPASSRQIGRAMPSPGVVMITETPALYKKVVQPLIDGIIKRGALSWIENVVTGRKETERLLHDAEGWILNIDTKWRTHPDALTVPRSEWEHHESVADLYCLGIIKSPQGGTAPATLRDLTLAHLPTLREMLSVGPQVIQRIYGVKSNQLRIYVHYQPQFYHFHVHFTRLENDIGCQVERGHLLSDIIQNLEMSALFYKQRTITYKLSLKEKLCKLMLAELEKDDDFNKVDEHESKEQSKISAVLS